MDKDKLALLLLLIVDTVVALCIYHFGYQLTAALWFVGNLVAISILWKLLVASNES